MNKSGISNAIHSTFTNFKSYSSFILQHHLDALVWEVIHKAKLSDLRILKLLTRFSEKEIFEIFKNWLAEDVLIPLTQDRPFDQLQNRIKAWRANNGVISVDQSKLKDIVAINVVKKRGLIHFIQFYDCTDEVKFNLIDEMEIYFETCIGLGIHAYEEIQKVEIKNKEVSKDVKQQETEEELINLIEGVKDYAIFKLNTDGTIASWNEGAASLKGYTKEEILGKHFSIFYPKEKRLARFPEYELEEAKRNGRFEDEGYRIRKDDSMFWANVIITPIYNDRDELVGFTKITRDLTERRLSEETLRNSEERYRLLIDAVNDYAIFIVDIEGRVVSWNEGAKRLKGYSEDEIVGKHISIFYTQEQKDENYPDYELEQTKKLGRFEDEGLRVRKDGSTFYANVILTALYDKDQRLLGFSKITRDLTERKAFEESLQNINAELEERIAQRTEELSKTVKELTKINNDLDNFIYTASHDLKAPVSNIEGLINGLFDEFSNEIQNNERLLTFKELINSSIQRFQSTIQELTEIAKIQKNFTEVTEVVDMNELVKDIQLSVNDLIVKNEAEIICDFKDNYNIQFVKKNIQSIFYNLISNGIKYRSPDRKPVILISSKRDDKYLVLSFKDNGLGVKPEHKARMFTMFKRFHDHVEGSGIGLYIVKRIVENAGGMIEIDSQLGEGTTFNIYIPNNFS